MGPFVHGRLQNLKTSDITPLNSLTHLLNNQCFSSAYVTMLHSLKNNTGTFSEYVSSLLSSVCSPLYLANLERPIDIDSSKDEAFYKAAVCRMSAKLLRMRQRLLDEDLSAESLATSTVLEALDLSKMLERCIRFVRTNDDSLNHLALLQASCLLERLLRSLYEQQGQCSPPHLLKDLLNSDIIAASLGTELLSLLDLLVGPPLSLNLRNLAWHGFGSDTERLGYFAPHILSACLMVDSRIRQLDISLPKVVYAHLDISQLCARHNFLCSTMAEESCFFTVMPSKRKLFSASVSLSEQGSYVDAIALLLTSFEHLMRVAFCVDNNLPDRMTTATQCSYFTTFDEILSEKLNDGSPNRLSLPPRLRSALLDLLYYTAGPRLRDRLSHLEIAPKQITAEVWCVMYNIINATIHHICGGTCDTPVGAYFLSYEPVYHPFSMLVCDSAKLYHRIHHNREFKCHSHEEMRNRSIVSIFPDSPDQKDLTKRSVFTHVSELCNLLHFAVKHLLQALDCMQDYVVSRRKMMAKRSLRSRQRKNYDTLMEIGSDIMQLICVEEDTIAQLMLDCKCGDRAVKKTHLQMLQLTENVEIMCSSNKWTELLGILQSHRNKQLIALDSH